MSVSAPTITDSVVQNFFIEALTGAQPPISYLDRFPDAVYTKAIDSLLVQFMYALLGPVGVGQLRVEYLEARLEIEQAGLQTTDLDSLYSNAFAFARAAEDTYQLDADSSLLPAAQRAQILTADANFRNRAIDFLKGARGGSTLRGLTLVAKSGLNRPVELIENYRALFDHYTDIPLGLATFGSTQSVAEVVVVPRQSLPQNAVQTLSLGGEPTSGWFTLTYPSGQLWSAIPISMIANSAVITVPNVAAFPPGVFVTLTNLATTSTAAQIDPTQPGWGNRVIVLAQSNGGSGTSVTLAQTLAGPTPGGPALAPISANFLAFVGVAQTTPLPYNATAARIQNALNALPVIGTGNVTCSGGPLPDQPVSIQFVNQLSDQPVETLQVNLNPDKATGINPVTVGLVQQMANILGSPLGITANLTVQTAGASATSQATVIAPADEYNLYAALNQTRPLTSLFTTQMGAADTIQQPINSTFSGSTQTEVVRYATGRMTQWPALDATHWIEAGIEHEAPVAYGATTQYQGFHNISTISSYTEAALVDPNYLSSTSMGLSYWDSLIGGYSANQLLLYPGLSALNSGNLPNQFLPPDAEAAQAEPLVITNLNGTGVINGNYPVDYMTLVGVPQPTGGLLWASAERPAGVDYLEIDLGTAQAVNFLYFEATNKPYLIDVAYDTLDQSPNRRFVATTSTPSPAGTSITSLNYQATQLWSTVTINITNSLGGMLYTRFLRIGFTKTPVGTVYGPVGVSPIPYSIEVQNLRVGRNAGISSGGVYTAGS